MLWQRILEWARYALKHKEQTEKNTADLKDQQQAFDEMTEAVRRLAIEVERLRDNEAHERKNLALQLEVILLRERQLPPGNSPSESEKDAQIQSLKEEIEELKKRLKELEQQSKG